jgi:acetyltransferase-like isoleucine patch superfamily enzyme
MPVSIIDTGSNNQVLIHPDHLEGGSGTITLRGSGNVVKIDRPYIYGAVHINVADGSSVSVGEDCNLSALFIDCQRGGSVSIGARTLFNGGSSFRADEDKGISVGEGCLFADEVRVWSSDMHSIIDVESGARLNMPREVRIGDRVWIGDRALVLKGSTIGSGSILGAASVLAGKIPENCVAAGNPARVVRRGVTWNRELLGAPLVHAVRRKQWFGLWSKSAS